MRSEVQVFPGPPAFALCASARQAFLNEGCCAVALAKASAANAFVFWNGAIAQLGERVLCKHEVVGSIPSGSTSFRWLCQLRLGKPYRSEGCRVVARKSEDGLTMIARLIAKTSSAKHHFARCILRDARAGFMTS